jgi:predicted transcriptional regulator
MDLIYLDALKEHNLKVSELPEDARVGITEITNIVKGFQMAERKGRKPTPQAMRKLKTIDKWVYYEILDYLNDTDKNDDEIPFSADEVLDELESKDASKIEEQADPVGLAIDQELSSLAEAGKNQLTLEELRKNAPKTYKEIWESYETGEENGIVTSHYSLIENDNEIFILKRK